LLAAGVTHADDRSEWAQPSKSGEWTSRKWKQITAETQRAKRKPAPRKCWRPGKLGRSPSNRHCRLSGWIALWRDSQAAPPTVA